jgi:hypothetical protein
MMGEMVPFVMLPRYSSFVGPGTYATAPVDVEAFTGGEVVFWRGPLVGGGTSPFTTYFECSHDALTWTTAAPSVNTANTESTFPLPFSKRWFRVRVVLVGDPTDGLVGISLWLVGTVERRIEAA